MNNLNEIKEEMEAVSLLAAAVRSNLNDIDKNTAPEDRSRLLANRIDLRKIVEPIMRGKSTVNPQPPPEYFQQTGAEGLYRPPPPPMPEQFITPAPVPEPAKDNRQMEFTFVGNSTTQVTPLDQKIDSILAEVRSMRNMLTKLVDRILTDDETETGS